jgi:hypothetical protein
LVGARWINLYPDKDKWQAVVNTVMNIWAPQNAVYLAAYSILQNDFAAFT